MHELYSFDKRLKLDFAFEEGSYEKIKPHVGDTIFKKFSLLKHEWKNSKIVKSKFKKEFAILDQFTDKMSFTNKEEIVEFEY